jgi:carboxymethylenebutenolidase
METYRLDGKVRLDHYSPSRAGASPAILLLHGSGGPLRGIDPFAEQAAGMGVHVFALHYFDRTGHAWVSPRQIEEHFLDWMNTAEAAVSHMLSLPGVDHRRVGLLGFSLGAYLSLALSTRDSRIAAVAELFGGLAEHFAADAAKLPPVLIVHGERDPVVPVQEAYKLEEVLKKNSIPYEIKIYRDQGHSLTGLAQLDAMRRVAGFFREHLRQAAWR